MINWFNRNKFSIAALVVTLAAWYLFANFVPRRILDIIVYGIAGWFWLGAVVIPWVEAKLTKLFQ